MQFTKLDEKVEILEKYFPLSEISFCDISVGEKYMWRNYFQIEYAIINDTLIMKESSPTYKDVFYFPMGKDVDGALIEIEAYCQQNHIPLTFCCIDEKVKDYLLSIYPLAEFHHERDWDDYIYDAEKDFELISVSESGLTGELFNGFGLTVQYWEAFYPYTWGKGLNKPDGRIFLEPIYLRLKSLFHTFLKRRMKANLKKPNTNSFLNILTTLKN